MTPVRFALFGAEGALGRALAHQLSQHHTVRAIVPHGAPTPPNTEALQWEHADPFSVGQCTEALRHAEVVVFLANPRVPQTLLVQCRAEDLQLLMADNIRRALPHLEANKVLFLSASGSPSRSRHVLTQRETEALLQTAAADTYVLRAGWIASPGSGVFRRLRSLHGTVPIAGHLGQSRIHPLAGVAQSVVELVRDHPPGTYRLEDGEVLPTDRFLRKLTGRSLRFRTHQRRNATLGRWSRMLHSTTRDAAQLHDLLLASPLDTAPLPFQPSTPHALGDWAAEATIENPRERYAVATRKQLRSTQTVRSVQRILLPEGWDAKDLEWAYFEWLRNHSRGLLRIQGSPKRGWCIGPRWGPAFLHMAPAQDRVDAQRRNLHILGGLLLRKNAPTQGWFEFRKLPIRGWALVALHDFAPALPWGFYRGSQALVHARVMDAFRIWLASPYRQ